MIASWMMYVCVVAVLFTVVAMVIDRLAAARGWPVRFVWMAALALSVLWPAGDAIRRLMPASLTPVSVRPFTITIQTTRVISSPRGPPRMAVIDRMFVVLWCAGSAALLLRLVRGIVTMQETRRGWMRADIDGTAVRLSANVGPAVVGLRSMEVVVPEWIQTLDAPLRAIILHHEQEHRTARDPYLLLLAAVAVVLMPWNIALWLQARRMRLAIEMDCDARVLRVHRSPERYGLLLMTIAQRRSAAPTLLAPMLLEPATQLERRIIAMQHKTRRPGRVATSGAVTIAAAILGLACSLKSDGPTGVPGAQSSASSQAALVAELSQSSRAQALPGSGAPRYPDLLRAARIEGEVVAQFVVDTNGTPDLATFRVLRSTHDLFTAAVRNALPSMRFSPPALAGRHVRQLFEMPFEFTLSHGVPSPSATIDRHNRGTPVRVSNNQTFVEFQVERTVSPRPDNRAPRYPDVLRSAKIEGEVLAQFVVGPDGLADTSTFKVVRSTHSLFTDAVRSALPRMRFNPAKVGGLPVKQLVQMPFQFNLSK
ncbi:MAG TPA: M56 family metallopeptidase [Gemmatimonadaceae bacterium]